VSGCRRAQGYRPQSAQRAPLRQHPDTPTLRHVSPAPCLRPPVALIIRVLPSKRLFVGLELPSGCKTTLFELDPHLTGLRWLPKEQLHLTLSFLGQVEASVEARLRQALSEVRVPPFFLPLRGVGVFYSRSRLSVVWVGVGKGHPHLFELHRRIQNAILQVGLEADLKAFHPHVTIGRANGIFEQALRPFIRSHAESEFGLVQVTSFALYSSVLAAEGATHRLEMSQEF
jgi:RNA 2',3'-cyclic 3'-phosphodiesterase